MDYNELRKNRSAQIQALVRHNDNLIVLKSDKLQGRSKEYLTLFWGS
jgi:hypothetical protein